LSAASYPIIVFPEENDERLKDEAVVRGYLDGVIVQMEDGSRYQIFFIDPLRLGQEIDGSFKSGRACFTEPGLVVIPQVTPQFMEKAVQELHRAKFFEDLKPL
jgi:hypothetical protein